MSIFFNPRWRLAWSATSAVITALFVILDWVLRSLTGESPLAPSATDLGLLVGVGMALGLVGMRWESYLLRHRRVFLLAFHRAPLAERLKWKHLGPNLLMQCWFTIPILLLIAWCYFSQVFVLPMLFAMNAVTRVFV